jgi:hypothetical protein
VLSLQLGLDVSINLIGARAEREQTRKHRDRSKKRD